MIAEMGDIIAAHNELKFDQLTGAASCKCGAKFSERSDSLSVLERKLNQHAARELIRAGYGKLATQDVGS